MILVIKLGKLTHCEEQENFSKRKSPAKRRTGNSKHLPSTQNLVQNYRCLIHLISPNTTYQITATSCTFTVCLTKLGGPLITLLVRPILLYGNYYAELPTEHYSAVVEQDIQFLFLRDNNCKELVLIPIDHTLNAKELLLREILNRDFYKKAIGRTLQFLQYFYKG